MKNYNIYILEIALSLRLYKEVVDED